MSLPPKQVAQLDADDVETLPTEQIIIELRNLLVSLEASKGTCAMTDFSPENIEAAALQLVRADRVRLVERLLSSFDEDDEILATWIEEAERRGDAYERGEMEAIDFDESIAKARARIANHRKT